MNKLMEHIWPATIFVMAIVLWLLASSSFAETLTLNEAIDYAIGHNKELDSKREQVAGAEAKLMQATAPVLPQLSAELSYMRLSQVPEINFTLDSFGSIPIMSTMDPISINKKMGDEDNYKAELKLQQLIFASGQAYKAICATKSSVKAKKHTVAAAEEELAKKVSEAFYSLIFAKEVFAAQVESLRTSEAHLKDVQNLYKFESASKFELLRSEVEVANLRPEVSKAQNRVKLAKNGLKVLLGMDHDEPLEISGSLESERIDLTYDSAVKSVRTNREEFLGLDAAIEAQKHLVWVGTAQWLPKIAAFGTLGTQKPWYFEEDWTELWSVGVGMSIPIFDGLSSLGKRREAQAQKREFEKQKDALSDGIDFTIRQALLDLEEIDNRITETKQNVNRAKEAYEIAEVSYKEGVLKNIEVLDAQLALTGARTKYIQALFDYQVAKTQLLAASGQLR